MSAMNVSDIAQALDARMFTSIADTSRNVQSACASDLMSDVLAFSNAKSILLTGLVSLQTVRTAEVADLFAVCFVFGKEPSDETVRLAEASNIPLMSTQLSLFSASGVLYEKGLSGCLEAK